MIVAAVGALTQNDAASVVLARYAGDAARRLDLASLSYQVPVAVDANGKLGPIDEGAPVYRAKVFEVDFPRKTTILEVSVPKIRGDRATLTAWRWDALAWKCDLPGRTEEVTLALGDGDGKWSVTAVSRGSKVLIQAGCP